MKTKVKLLLVALIITAVLCVFEGYQYFSLIGKYGVLEKEYLKIRQELESLNRTYQTLLANHTQLHASFLELAWNHEELKREHQQLLTNYTDLLSKYRTLTSKYQALVEDYQKLSEAFNEPLSYEELPTINELIYWLTFEDQTDKIAYNYPDFICGDFAFMLALHAKLKHWDMGVVAIFGYDEKREPFAHVFNAILCKEGLVYVEPQTDDVWWYENHKEITEGKWYEYPGKGRIYVERYIIILRYD